MVMPSVAAAAQAAALPVPPERPPAIAAKARVRLPLPSPSQPAVSTAAAEPRPRVIQAAIMVPAPASAAAAIAVTARPRPEPDLPRVGGWAIQVGAYGSPAQARVIAEGARSDVPDALAAAAVVNAPRRRQARVLRATGRSCRTCPPVRRRPPANG